MNVRRSTIPATGDRVRLKSSKPAPACVAVPRVQQDRSARQTALHQRSVESVSRTEGRRPFCVELLSRARGANRQPFEFRPDADTGPDILAAIYRLRPRIL